MGEQGGLDGAPYAASAGLRRTSGHGAVARAGGGDLLGVERPGVCIGGVERVCGMGVLRGCVERV